MKRWIVFGVASPAIISKPGTDAPTFEYRTRQSLNEMRGWSRAQDTKT